MPAFVAVAVLVFAKFVFFKRDEHGRAKRLNQSGVATHALIGCDQALVCIALFDDPIVRDRWETANVFFDLFIDVGIEVDELLIAKKLAALLWSQLRAARM